MGLYYSILSLATEMTMSVFEAGNRKKKITLGLDIIMIALGSFKNSFKDNSIYRNKDIIIGIKVKIRVNTWTMCHKHNCTWVVFGERDKKLWLEQDTTKTQCLQCSSY